METNKPFKDTKVGEWLSTNLPTALNIVGGVLPSQGAFGIVKNIISSHPALSPGQKQEGLDIVLEHEKLYYSDLENARSREVEITKATGKKDVTMIFLTIYGTVSPVLILLYLLIFGFPKPIDNGTAALLGGFIGTLFSAFLMIFNYHFSSTTGSKAKDETINTLSKN